MLYLMFTVAIQKYQPIFLIVISGSHATKSQVYKYARIEWWGIKGWSQHILPSHLRPPGGFLPSSFQGHMLQSPKYANT